MESPEHRSRPGSGSARPRAVIACGTGRYADPWHPFPATSVRIADLLERDGWQIDAIIDPDRALGTLEGVDLLVVNAGDPWRGDEAERGADPAAEAGLDAALDRGIGILAMHSALSTLRDYPRWREAIGGWWEPGHSWHPPLGETEVRVVDTSHPVTSGMQAFTVVDERYCELVLAEGNHVLAVHDVEGAAHPAVWARESPVRAVVSSLGHDERSYDSEEHRMLLARAARWTARV